MKTTVKFVFVTLVAVAFLATYILLLPEPLWDRHPNVLRQQRHCLPSTCNGTVNRCRLAPIACTFARMPGKLQCAVDEENRTAVYIPLHLASSVAEITGEYEQYAPNVYGRSEPTLQLFLTKYSYYRPLQAYRPSGKFLSFANYHVESRDRVKCVSAESGVPISLQWKRTGHYYPTQIAQFGLQHYSQYLQKSPALLGTGNSSIGINRLFTEYDDAFFRASNLPKDGFTNLDLRQHALPLEFGTADENQCARLVVTNAEKPDELQKSLKNLSIFVVGFLCPKGCSFTVHLEFPAAFVVPVKLRYDAYNASLANEQLSASITFHDNKTARSIDISYSMLNARIEYLQLVRDVKYDVQKGVSLLLEKEQKPTPNFPNHVLVRDAVLPYNKANAGRRSAKKLPRKRKIWKSAIEFQEFRITKIELCGAGFVSPHLSLFSADDAEPHKLNFLKAADWLLKHQYSDGSWRVNATHYIGSNMQNHSDENSPSFSASPGLVLRPGWCSAMAQGHALSVLSRAYLVLTNVESVLDKTKVDLYRNAALKALQVFERSIKNQPISNADDTCGVVSKFPGNVTWFEEYPTTPPIFVLNGFLYALFGLFDAASVFNDSKAKKLWSTGMQSLSKLLPLYDTGSGSWYDLRHFSLGGGGGILPNRARWDYHVTHITQLLALGTIAHSFDGQKTNSSGGVAWPSSFSHQKSDISSLLNTTAERWISYTEGYRVPHN